MWQGQGRGIGPGKGVGGVGWWVGGWWRVCVCACVRVRVCVRAGGRWAAVVVVVGGMRTGRCVREIGARGMR